MPSKTPFGPEVIAIQRHTQYSVQATDGVYYHVNTPLTLLDFQDGAQYTVSGSVSAKGNKYISEIVSGQVPVAQAPIQQPGLPPLPVAPSMAVAAPSPQPSIPLPVAQPSAPSVPAPANQVPPPYKKDNVEGKVACALGVGLTQYLASVAQNEAEFMVKYRELLPQLIEYHRSKGWI